jgi:nitrogen fixation protein NifB
MEIDYDAAMVKRAKVHEAIAQELNAKQKEKQEEIVAVDFGEKGKTYRPVLMAVATTGGGVINQHFGHAKEFLVYEATKEGVRFIGHRKTDLYCSGNDTCGDGDSVLGMTIKALEGCEVVLCSKIGYEPWDMLENAGIAPNGEHAMESIEDAVFAVYKEMIETGQLESEPLAEQASA